MENKEFVYAGQRNKLVELLHEKGISDKNVLEAIRIIPRHLFLEKGAESHAYIDKAVQIGSGQTISQPYTVAFQTQLLEIKKNDKVLEIGTGSGYQASVLAQIDSKVFSIERHKPLYIKSKEILKKLNYNINVLLGDGFKGLPNLAPFDKIIVTCGAPEIPSKLLMQLKIGGIMVVPVDKKNEQDMLKIKKVSEKDFEISSHGKFMFVPMLKGIVD
jgi:protein-L-isoaspartate(D-aspartate) O-methyltransferase